MDLESRSFERFEADEGRLDLERLVDCAATTDSDPLAIIASLWLERPELALRCADNKLLLVQAISLERLNDRLGDRLSKVAISRTTSSVRRSQISIQVAGSDARDARCRDWWPQPPEGSEVRRRGGEPFVDQIADTLAV